MLLKDLGEGGLIEQLRGRFRDSRVALGIGDDTAIVKWPAGQSVAFCSDLMVENTHFIRGLHPADSVGYKAVAANVSDVGAMGGVAVSFVVSLALPNDLELDWVERFYDGVERAVRDFDVALAGGDSSSAGLIFVDVAMIGRVEQGREVRRSGARPGDGVYVTGALGGSALGLELLRRGETTPAAAIARHLYPQPRPRVGAAVAGRATAMIDISDGLSTDLGHLAAESGVAIQIYKEKIPRAAGASDQQVLHGGEEYELIIVAPQLPAEIEGVPLTRIGEVIAATAEPGVFLAADASGPAIPLRPQGWQHF